MKVFLDDERDTPIGWVRTFWPEEVISLLRTGRVSELSLDHDLGDDTHGTGYSVLLWIEEQVFVNKFPPPKLTVHSANSSARLKMELAISTISRQAEENQMNDIKVRLEMAIDCVYNDDMDGVLHHLKQVLSVLPQPQQGEWLPIESAPKNSKKMFVVKAFNVRFNQGGLMPYTSDPYCVWSEDDKFVRWPHINFEPTHWMPIPNPPKEVA